MRYVRNRKGLNRLKTNRQYTGGNMSNYNNISKAKKEESEDTKIRRDIHVILVRMAKDNKSSIEIKYCLTDKYPDYEEYIIKMINQLSSKMDSLNTKPKASREEGDER